MKTKKTKLNPVRNSTSGGYATEGKISNGINAIRYTLCAILAGCLLVIAAGCENAGRKLSLTEEINTLRREKKVLARQIEKSKLENKDLKKQIRVLSDLPPGVKTENLYRLQRIKITKYTDFYDKDKDGRKEKLIVYIQPLDEDGDIIKAVGAVDVRLQDPNKNKDQAPLGQWHVEPNQLKKLWLATFISTNYKLTFDVADKIEGLKEPLTVKVTFTDYLTGNVFNEEKKIRPR
ncbi:hypothetical protein ES703_89117 [subsurface metagenome]